MFQVLTGFWKQLWASRFLFKGSSIYYRHFLPPIPAFCSVFSPISSSALPICSSSLRRRPHPMSVSSSFHAVPRDIISPGGLSLPTRSTFHPSHPPHPSVASWWSVSRLPLRSSCSSSALTQHCRSHTEFTHLPSGPVFWSLASLHSLRNPRIMSCLFSPSAKLKQIVSIC